MPIQIEQDGRGVVTAWLDNAAKRNALDDAMLGSLAGLLETADGRGGGRVLVIRGLNDCFCAGRDLGALATADSGEDLNAAARLLPINRLAQAFQRCPIPTVALVHGKAAGLGVSLTCWADIAIATGNAGFGLPEARAGIAPSITAVSLMEVVGRRRALDLCLTGRTVDADTAASMGLVQYVCKPEDAADLLETVLQSLLKGAPQAIRDTKALGRQAEGKPCDVALALANATAQRSLQGHELAEGLSALREKRPPAWQPTVSASATPSTSKVEA